MAETSVKALVVTKNDAGKQEIRRQETSIQEV